MNFPKVLVLANNSFSQTNSNGRTLGNFFMNWPKDKLAQFALLADGLDTARCTHYFIVTDRQALQSFKTGKPAKNSFAISVASVAVSTPNGKKIKRSPFTMLLRNLVWKSNRWRGKEFNEWVDAFQPEMILLQAGDSPFMYDLAVSLAKERHIPLVMYNSECYYFKDFCYFRNTRSGWLYPLFRYIFKRSFERAMQNTSGVIYITKALENLHQSAFKHNSLTLMTASALPKQKHLHPLPDLPHIVYLGNLGLNRHKNLIKIAQEVQKINPSWKVEIYGRPPLQAEQELKVCSAIVLKGFVPYKEVLHIQQTADLLLHTEYSDPFFMKDLQYAFSTKIADCLSAGVPFLVFAPETFSFIKYLQENKAAFVAVTTEELFPALKSALLNPIQRQQQVENALKLARQNHDALVNAGHFEQFLQEIYENTPHK